MYVCIYMYVYIYKVHMFMYNIYEYTYLCIRFTVVTHFKDKISKDENNRITTISITNLLKISIFSILKLCYAKCITLLLLKYILYFK